MEFENIKTFDPGSLKLDEAEYRDVFLTDEQKADGYKAIFNTTQNAIVRIKKNNKTLIQHADFIKTFKDVSEDLGLDFTGNIIERGNQIQVFAYLKDSVADDGVKLGVVLKNRYGSGTSVGMYGFRMACENSLVLDKTARERVVVENAGQLAGVLKSCINTMINESPKLMNKLIADAQKEKIDIKLAKQLLNILVHSKKHRERISEILDENCKEDSVSRWDLYNCMTQYSGESTVTSNGNDYIQNQAQKILNDMKFNAVKQKAVEVEVA